MNKKVMNSMAICLCIMIVLSLMATISVPMATAIGDQVTIQGWVYYADGATPVNEATVYIYYSGLVEPVTAITGPDGYYYQDFSVPAYSDHYQWKAEKNGIESLLAYENIVGSQEDIHANMIMPLNTAHVTFSGRVTYDGNPQAEAIVRVTYAGQSLEFWTLPDGYYTGTIEAFDGGVASMTATYNGITTSPNVTVIPGPDQTVAMDFAIGSGLPPAVVTLSGHVSLSDGSDAANAQVFVSYGGSTDTHLTDPNGFYRFELPYSGGALETWVVYNGVEYVHVTYSPAAEESIVRDWILSGTGTASPSPGVSIAPAVSPSPPAVMSPTPTASVVIRPSVSTAPTQPVTVSPTAVTGASKTPFPGAPLTLLVIAGMCAFILRRKND